MIERILVDTNRSSVSEDFYFAAFVAMFRQLLKNSDYKGEASFNQVIALDKQSLSNDKHGYKR